MDQNKEKVAILLAVEKGYLEHQARLFINSINKYYNSVSHDVEIFAFSPRKDHQPSTQTREFLAKNTTHHFTENLNTEHQDFPLLNGHLGARFFEKHHPEYKHVLLLDTDTVFFNDFEFLFQQSAPGLYLTPVDNKGVGTSGESDRDHLFWKNLYQHLGIDLPEQRVTTRVGMEEIWPYYNAGFAYVNDIPGFFTQWVKDYESILNSGIRSEFSGKNSSKTIFLEQVALALCSQRHRGSIAILPEIINYPIPFHPKLKHRSNSPQFKDLVHVHYHRWFQHPGFLDHITCESDRGSEQYQWLQQELPLQPEIDGPFKC